MPLFQFKCVKCNKISEKIFLHKTSVSIESQIQDYIDLKCPECGGDIERQIGEPALKFKGKDFYVTEERARRERQRVNNDIRIANERIDQQKRSEASKAKGPES